jgi:hypothetical protein
MPCNGDRAIEKKCSMIRAISRDCAIVAASAARGSRYKFARDLSES